MTTKVALAGQQAYTTAGSYTFTVPAGITSISVVCVSGGSGGGANGAFSGSDGGGLAYRNNIAVSGGQSVSVVVGSGGSGANIGGDSSVTVNSTVQCRAIGGGGGGTGFVGDVFNMGGYGPSGGGGGGAGG
jgi:hypothetical protein